MLTLTGSRTSGGGGGDGDEKDEARWTLGMTEQRKRGRKT